MTLDYFYGEQADQFTFYRIPKALFTEERFKLISAEAKILYGILLDRMSLSRRNGWLDEQSRVFIIFTLDEVMDAIGCADQKATKLLNELESKAGLIERKRQGLGKPNLIYVKNFVNNSSGSASETPESRIKSREIHDSGTVKITNPESRKSQSNNTEKNNTDLSETDTYLLDKTEPRDGYFAFKHHYITSAMDSEIVCTLLNAISEKRNITIETLNRHTDIISESHVVPLRIMASVQSGRQYLMAYDLPFERIRPFRTDNIESVKIDDVSERFEELRDMLDGMTPHLWGVSTQSFSGDQMEHVEFTVKYSDDEMHIPERLEREKRCGTVEKIDSNTSKFSADVYDSSELIPWIRTFICRITDISFSNSGLQERFNNDLTEMYALYDLEGGDGK